MNETTEYIDIVITCRDCSKEFTFTADGQRFFDEKGYARPVRCKSCRIKRKAQIGPSIHYHAPHDN